MLFNLDRIDNMIILSASLSGFVASPLILTDDLVCLQMLRLLTISAFYQLRLCGLGMSRVFSKSQIVSLHLDMVNMFRF